MSTGSQYPPANPAIQSLVRERMKPAGVTGGVLALIGSVVLMLCTLIVPWASIQHTDSFGNPTERSGATLLEISDSVGVGNDQLVDGLLVVFPFIMLVIAVTYFLYRRQHMRRIWAIIELFLATIVMILGTVSIANYRSPREGGFLAVLVALIVISGCVAAWAGNTGPTVVVSTMGLMVPMAPQPVPPAPPAETELTPATEPPTPDQTGPRRVRAPMRPAAVTGGALVLTGSIFLLLSTFLSWKLFRGDTYSLWELGDLLLESVLYVPAGVLVTAALVIVPGYFLPTQRARLVGSVTGLLVAVAVLGVMIWTLKTLDDVPASSHGPGGFLAVPAIVIMIIGGITAWAGNSTPAVALPMMAMTNPVTSFTTVEGQPPAPGETALTRQLRELATLRDQGIITEDEFQAKKTQLLGLD